MDNTAPMLCPWDRKRQEHCIGYQTPQCWQQCKNERNLRDAIEMYEHKHAREWDDPQTTFNYFDEIYGKRATS